MSSQYAAPASDAPTLLTQQALTRDGPARRDSIGVRWNIRHPQPKQVAGMLRMLSSLFLQNCGARGSYAGYPLPSALTPPPLSPFAALAGPRKIEGPRTHLDPRARSSDARDRHQGLTPPPTPGSGCPLLRPSVSRGKQSFEFSARDRSCDQLGGDPPTHGFPQ